MVNVSLTTVNNIQAAILVFPVTKFAKKHGHRSIDGRINMYEIALWLLPKYDDDIERYSRQLKGLPEPRTE